MRTNAARHTGELGDPRSAPVSGHDDPRAKLAALAIAAFDDSAVDSPVCPYEVDRRLAEQQLGARVGGELAHDRIELLAADAVAVRRIGRGLVEPRSNPSVAGPEL